MPPNNSTVSFQQSNNRKRTASERVVPAIPLTLSKPKPSKPKPKAEKDVRADAEIVTRDGQSAAAPNAVQEQQPVLNGASHPSAEAKNIANGGLVDDEAVKMPPGPASTSQGSTPMSVSNGATPEMQTANSTRPTTPPTMQPTSGTASLSSSSRKPTDRFDMRHIRTELPPAFIPSAEQHTPRSAASSQSNRPQSFHSHAHPSGGSMSLVFGGQDSSTSSPAPPHSAGSGFGPPPYPSFTPTQQPYFVPQGHAHTSSEPHAHRMFHPGYPQPAMPWNTRPNYAQAMPQMPYFNPHGHMPVRQPPRDVFPGAEMSQPNGGMSRSRSASQHSSTAQDSRKNALALQSPLAAEPDPDSAKIIFPEPKAAFPGQSHPRQAPFNTQMPPPPAQFPHPDVAANVENAELLRSHISSKFLDPEFVDCRLEISEEHNGETKLFDGHRIVLCRSQVLLSLMQVSQSQSPGVVPSTVQVKLRGQYMRIEPFMDALKYLYGGALLPLDQYRPGSSGGEHIPPNAERMTNALNTIATGAWLKIPAVANRGIDVTAGLLHWDTIVAALTFAFDGGLSPLWTVDDGSEDRASTSSSDDSLGRVEATSVPTYDPYSTHLLQRILDFMILMFPPNFYLDSAAPQLASCPRIPAQPLGHESRPSRSDPRLSQIRFGDIPVEEHERLLPSFATTTISSILLSLPFALLKWVLEQEELVRRIGAETVASIMRQVVAERESRRSKALKARTNSDAGRQATEESGAELQLVQNLFWAESVEASGQHRAGFRLARRRTDIDTPPSSGACSERNK